MTIGTSTRNHRDAGTSKSSTFYRSTTAGDYDRQFANRLVKTKPPYEIDKMLNHHFDHYVLRFPEQENVFLKHIKYVVLPLIEKMKDKSVYVELLNIWIQEKNAALKLNNAVKIDNRDNVYTIEKKETDFIFISYCWESELHEEKVLQFTDHLRKKGFDARIDKLLSQTETAINFDKMTHDAVRCSKIIVILSMGYKEKAEKFLGGVGEEYQMFIADIKKSPKKYILVSFQGRDENITPIGFSGREIIDMSDAMGEDRLFRKLLDIDKFAFSEVASQKPNLSSDTIGAFELEKKNSKIIKPISRENWSMYHLGGNIKNMDTVKDAISYINVYFGKNGVRQYSGGVAEDFTFSFQILMQYPESYKKLLQELKNDQNIQFRGYTHIE